MSSAVSFSDDGSDVLLSVFDIDAVTLAQLERSIPEMRTHEENEFVRAVPTDNMLSVTTLTDILLTSDSAHLVPQDVRTKLFSVVMEFSKGIVSSSSLAPPEGFREYVLERVTDQIGQSIRDDQLVAVWYATNVANGRVFLADDHGAGKCVAPDTLIFVNGCYIKAEKLWNTYAAADTIELDGNGAWAVPSMPLEVVSHGSSGNQTCGRVTRLYRQHVEEPLYTVTLTGGNRITCTGRHRLLTSSGWKRADKVDQEDFVAVSRRSDRHGLSVEDERAVCQHVSLANQSKQVGLPAYDLHEAADSPNVDLVSDSDLLSNLGHERFGGSSSKHAGRAADDTWQLLSDVRWAVRDKSARMVQADVAWSQVESVTLSPYVGHVYDLSVADHHNYVAEGIVTHNTIQAHTTLLLRGVPAVIVCKATLKGVMEDEIAKWVGEDARVYTLYGQKPLEGGLPEADYYIVNYELLRYRLDELIATQPKALVFDESQSLKTPAMNDTSARKWVEQQRTGVKKLKRKPVGSLRTWASGQLAKAESVETILMLSATPAPNGRHIEWMPQIEILGRLDDLGGRKHFEARYTRSCLRCVESHSRVCTHRPMSEFNMRGRKVPNTFGAINSKELSDRIRATMMIRRSQRQIMPFLPPINTVEVTLPLKPDLEKEYRRVEDEFKDWLKEYAAEKARKEGTSIKRAIANAMRNASGDNELLIQITHLRQAAARAKMESVSNYIEDLIAEDTETHEPRKVVLFAWHKDIQKELVDTFTPIVARYRSRSIEKASERKAAMEAYKTIGVPRILASADMPDDSIRESKRRFQEDPEEPIIVCSIGAAAEGHTLDSAYFVAFCEDPWQPAQLRQGVGRAYGRSSNPHGVTAIHLRGAGTIDLDIADKLDAKRSTMASTLDEGRELEWADTQAGITSEEIQASLLARYLET